MGGGEVGKVLSVRVTGRYCFRLIQIPDQLEVSYNAVTAAGVML